MFQYQTIALRQIKGGVFALCKPMSITSRFELPFQEIASIVASALAMPKIAANQRSPTANVRGKGGSCPRSVPPVMRNGPPPLCVTGPREKEVGASTTRRPVQP